MSGIRFFQVLRQAASDAFLKDASVLKPAVDILKAQKTTSYVSHIIVVLRRVTD